MGVILRYFLRLTSPEMPPVFKDSGPRKGAKFFTFDSCKMAESGALPVSFVS